MRPFINQAIACLMMVVPIHSACAQELPYVLGFRHALKDLADKPIHRHTQIKGALPALLNNVNAQVNRVPYTRIEGYWSTPKEFYANGGECRDFATVKYYELYLAGVADSDMEVAIFPLSPILYHAVLLVHHEGWIYVLDNRTTEIVRVQRFKSIATINRIKANTYP